MNEENTNKDTAHVPPSSSQPAFNAQEMVTKAQDMFQKGASISGWSWGGFMFGPAYLIAVKKYVYLLAYLVVIIPVIGQIAMLGMAIFLGIKGHELVAESTMFKNDDERNGFSRAINHAGFVSFLITVTIFILGFLFIGAIMGALFGGFGGEFGPGDMYY